MSSVSQVAEKTTAQVSSRLCTSDWHDGFNAFMDGKRIEDMPTNQHCRGWWAALEVEAYAKTPAAIKPVNVEAELEDYREWRNDNEFWAGGQW